MTKIVIGSDPRWLRVKEIFHAALALDMSQRAAFLDSECEADPDLRAEIDRLLKAHEESGTFIEQSPVAGGTLSGQVIGRYEVGRLVGRGGMGEVFEARDVELGRTLALKIAIGGDADAHARLRREAQHASQLNHPNICTIYEVGSFGGRPFIAMEYVRGQRLSDVIPKGGLPPDQVARYGEQIADALAYAHQHRVIHRDLKSGNVGITPEGRAKVLDFGLARKLPADELKEISESRAPSTIDAAFAGTLACMAPETLRGEQDDERSDIWALGVLLYEMASGARPFAGATPFQLSGSILHEPPGPLPSHVPAWLQVVITKCLGKDPRDRFHHAADVRAALMSKPQARRAFRALTTTLVAMVFLIGAATAIYWWRGAKSAPASPSGRAAIAIMPFDASAAGAEDRFAWLSSGVPSMLLTGLAQTRGLEIVSSERLSEALKRRGGGSLASMDRSQAADIARQAGAGAAVFGSIFRADSEIRIDARLEDLATGRVLVAQSVRGSDVFALVDRLAADLRNGIGFSNVEGIRPVSDVSTPSLEAYRLYSLAVVAFEDFRVDEAERLLNAAVAIDPEFAEAYQELAHVMGFRNLVKRQQEYLRRAREHGDRLSERRRLILDVQLARSSGDRVTAARLLDELLAKYRDVEPAYLQASLIYTPEPGRAGDLPKLRQILAAGTAAMPASRSLRNYYGYALAESKQYADALREFNMYVQLAPLEPNSYDSLAEGYLLAGDAEKAGAAYARALEIDRNYGGGHNGLAYSRGALGRYEDALVGRSTDNLRALLFSRVGRYREASEALSSAIEGAVRDDRPAERSWLLLLSAELAIEQRQFVKALAEISLAENAVAALPLSGHRSHTRLARLLGGVAHVGAGRIDLARRELALDRRLGDPPEEVEKWWHQALAGEVALASRDLETADAAFAAGEPKVRMWFEILPGTVALLANTLLVRDGPARTAKARGDLRGALEIYRRLLSYGPDSKWVAPLEPRYVLESARLLNQLGDKDGARKEYLRFLDLWKHADPGLPELAEARKFTRASE